MTANEALLIDVTFPRGGYSGSDLGVAEEIPSPARLHAAFVAAAAGGPAATRQERALIAGEAERRATNWLEDHSPIAISVPHTRPITRSARRYRLRAAPTPYLNDTPFEAFTALSGAVSYAWPMPPADLLSELDSLSREITHVGTADSLAVVGVRTGVVDSDDQQFQIPATGRGPGRVLRIPRPGRLRALETAHAEALSTGRHGAGSGGRQAHDVSPPTAGDAATELQRFVSAGAGGAWPYGEAWWVPLEGRVPRWVLREERRVAFATAAHRSIVRAIGSDVPAFVTGRDGAGPLRGPGHLALHLLPGSDRSGAELIVALPGDVAEADRATLLEALGSGLRVRVGRGDVRLGAPTLGSALPFWSTDERVMQTTVPLVLDNAGAPRRGAWSLDDAVLCSIGYALRAIVESDGFEWGSGWEFRRGLVAELRRRGVRTSCSRVAGSASRYAHRVPDGELLVAVDARVDLGELAPLPGGFLALGRARHLGGGLLVPDELARP